MSLPGDRFMLQVTGWYVVCMFSLVTLPAIMFIIDKLIIFLPLHIPGNMMKVSSGGLSIKIIVNNFANIAILPVAIADPQGQGHQGICDGLAPFLVEHYSWHN